MEYTECRCCALSTSHAEGVRRSAASIAVLGHLVNPSMREMRVQLLRRLFVVEIDWNEGQKGSDCEGIGDAKK